MLIATPLIVGDQLWGTVYVLEKIGDWLPVHVHEDESTNHITILTHGSVRLHGHDRFAGKVRTAEPGKSTILKWTAGEPHGIEALTDGVSFVNLGMIRT